MNRPEQAFQRGVVEYLKVALPPDAWWRSHFLAVELGIAAAAVAAIAGWAECLSGTVAIDTLLAGNRGPVYGTLASIFGSLLGFTITAASIVLGFSSSPRLRIIRESKHYPTLWKVFGATIRALGLATVVSLAALIVDRENTPNHWALYAAVFAFALSCLRIVRTVWVLENIIGLMTHPVSIAIHAGRRPQDTRLGAAKWMGRADE